MLSTLGRRVRTLSWQALVQLSGNEPVDPNDRDTWRIADEHAQAVLRRHGITLTASPDAHRDPGAQRRAGTSRPRSRPRLDHGHGAGEPS